MAQTRLLTERLGACERSDESASMAARAMPRRRGRQRMGQAAESDAESLCECGVSDSACFRA